MSDLIASRADYGITTMFSAIMSFAVQFLLLGPFQAQLDEGLAQANAPYEIISQVKGCAATALPELVERATADPMWAVSGAARVWLVGTSPEQVVRDAMPSCRSAIASASDYLRSPKI
jgi:hypothetical protein